MQDKHQDYYIPEFGTFCPIPNPTFLGIGYLLLTNFKQAMLTLKKEYNISGNPLNHNYNGITIECDHDLDTLVEAIRDTKNIDLSLNFITSNEVINSEQITHFFQTLAPYTEKNQTVYLDITSKEGNSHIFKMTNNQLIESKRKKGEKSC